jgi:hypothetical protein
MNRIHRALLVAGALAMASVASAQTTGGNGGATNAAGNGGTNQAGTGTQTLTLATAPTITNTANGGITAGTADSSNLLGGYYANPLYQGARSVSGNLTDVVKPGGFGSSTFTTGGSATVGGGGNATGGRGGATAGRAGGSTTGALAGGTTLGGSTLGGGGGAAGRQAGGLGGGAQGGGIGGAANSQNSNQQLSTGRSIAYTQTLKFGVAPMTMTAVQTDVVNMLATSSVAGANQVQATAGDFGTVILSGRVADEDSAKLIEGMVMLTPGVKQVKNDIKFPKP